MVNKIAVTKLQEAVEIIYAGGTSTISASPEGYIASGRAYNLIGLLEERYPDFKLDISWGRKQVAYNGLSENMISTCWYRIDNKVRDALSRQPRSVLITYGTDSMEQALRHLRAAFYQQISLSGQTIIVTGANRDIEDPDTDAWDNLMFALEQSARDLPPDIYLAFHGKLITGDEAVKLPYTQGTDQTFVSRSDLTYKQALHEQQDKARKYNQALMKKFDRKIDDSLGTIYNVNQIRLDHQKFIDDIGIHSRTRGVILNLYRCGTANTEEEGYSVAELVTYLRNEKNIVCFGVTENGEPVDLHAYETSVKLRKAGVVPLYNMLREVALTKLCLLPDNITQDDLIKAMLHSDIGEIDESLVISEDIKELLKLYK